MDLVERIARAASQAANDKIVNPKIILAAKLSLNTYRLLVSTDLSPNDPTSKYYVQFDLYLRLTGDGRLYGIENVQAKDFIIPTCT